LRIATQNESDGKGKERVEISAGNADSIQLAKKPGPYEPMATTPSSGINKKSGKMGKKAGWEGVGAVHGVRRGADEKSRPRV